MESISSRLQSLFNELERIDSPLCGPIQVVLQACVQDVRSVETNFGFPDLIKENQSLKEKLQAVEVELGATQRNLESNKSNAAAQIDVLRKELDTLRTEQKKREEKEAELPSDQLRILTLLSPLQRLIVLEIRAKLPDVKEDELAWHLAKLKALGYADFGRNAWDAEAWFRTERGNTFVIARRLAGEDNAGPNRNGERLAPLEEAILLFLEPFRGNPQFKAVEAFQNGCWLKKIAEHIRAGEKITETYLLNLEKGGVAVRYPHPVSFGDEDADYWFRTDNGDEYLAKRGLLK